MLCSGPGGQVSRLRNEFHLQRSLELTKFRNIWYGAGELLSACERLDASRTA